MGNQMIWIRLGSNAEYEEFGDDFDAAAGHLYEFQVHTPLNWIESQHGFTSAPCFTGDYISCFWGDADAQFVRDLTIPERRQLEAALYRCKPHRGLAPMGSIMNRILQDNLRMYGGGKD